MNTAIIKNQLRTLRMYTAAKEIDDFIAESKKAIDLDWLSLFLQKELDQRYENNLQARIKAGKFPEITALESFDFDFNPKIDQDKIRKLADLSFVEKKQIALFLGSPGTGKTHLAIGIGLLAVHQGKKVYCTSTKRLSQEILSHKARNNMDLLFKKILGSHLWILDDWGVVSLEKEVAEEIFDLMDRRKQTTAMILTSNRDVTEWGQMFPDLILANATVDRIFDRAHTILFKGPSYRLKNRIDLNTQKNDLDRA